ncbi:MAG: ATP-binding protein [Anaerolineales bacterium]
MPVDLSAALYSEYQKTRRAAEDAERQGKTGEAAGAHRKCAELLRQYAEYSLEPTIRKQRLERVQAHQEAAVRLEQAASKAPARPQAGARPPAQSDTPAGEDDYESEILALIQRPNVKWTDIGGLESTKNAIKSAYALSLARKPKGVGIQGSSNILLFGPPGTGKTILAAATAGSLDATFFNVKVSNLLSKYFGESTKLISALYAVARRMSPAVIFLDEFESLTPPRGSGESGAERRIVSTLLAELDGLDTKDETRFVLTMGATNVPWLLDSAILSRFQKRIYVPLPDDDTRRAIFEIHISRKGHSTRLSMEELIRRTRGYSGREIEQLCQIAVSQMIARANPMLLGIVDQGQEAVRDYELKIEPLTEEDFRIAFEQIRPVANPQMLRQYEDWLKKLEV